METVQEQVRMRDIMLEMKKQETKNPELILIHGRKFRPRNVKWGLLAASGKSS